MSAKIIVQAADGGIPSEAEGMAIVMQFLAEIHEDGADIDDIRQTNEGIYIIYPHRLSQVGYNPMTGEMLSDPSDSNTVEVESGWCGKDDVCYQGCGCKCWVDRGWMTSIAPEIRDPNAVHCKDAAEE